MPQEHREPKPSDLLLKSIDWIAEVPSLALDRFYGYSGPLSSWDALCLIYIFSHVGDRYWMTEEVFRKIANKAYLADYQGEWQIVQDFLQKHPTSPSDFYEIWLAHKSPEEFFGNLRRRAAKLSMLVRSITRNPHRKPVTYPQRARGYKDKGTLRPPHEFHGDPPVKAQKMDLRHLVGHPLLSGDREETGREDDLTDSGGEKV